MEPLLLAYYYGNINEYIPWCRLCYCFDYYTKESAEKKLLGVWASKIPICTPSALFLISSVVFFSFSLSFDTKTHMTQPVIFIRFLHKPSILRAICIENGICSRLPNIQALDIVSPSSIPATEQNNSNNMSSCVQSVTNKQIAVTTNILTKERKKSNLARTHIYIEAAKFHTVHTAIDFTIYLFDVQIKLFAIKISYNIIDIFDEFLADIIHRQQQQIWLEGRRWRDMG